MRKAYRRTITLLWHSTQERGAHLTIQHVHSHLEKKTFLNDPKYNERWQLAAADEACEKKGGSPRWRTFSIGPHLAKLLARLVSFQVRLIRARFAPILMDLSFYLTKLFLG